MACKFKIHCLAFLLLSTAIVAQPTQEFYFDSVYNLFNKNLNQRIDTINNPNFQTKILYNEKGSKIAEEIKTMSTDSSIGIIELFFYNKYEQPIYYKLLKPLTGKGFKNLDYKIIIQKRWIYSSLQTLKYMLVTEKKGDEDVAELISYQTSGSRISKPINRTSIDVNKFWNTY